MRLTKLLFTGLVCLATLAGAGLAQPVDLDGFFIALSDCEANRKKDSDNPGAVRLERMRAYEMLTRNTTPGTHYRIRVPGAPELEERWVPTSCGAYAPRDALVTSGGNPGGGTGGGGAGLPPDGIEAVLAASWQPGFCATPAGGGKPECRSQAASRFDATHFSIHGLWPDDLDDKAIFPCYCDRGAPVSCADRQDEDASVELSAAILDELKTVMPGVQSDLHLHEWPKHGACYEDDRTGEGAGADPDEYFGEAIGLLRQLNGSSVQALFEANVGQVLQRERIEAAFEETFGAGAGERVVIRCFKVGGDNVITELWIALKGEITPQSDLGELVRAAPPAATSTNTRSCNSGLVVKVAGN